MHSIIFYVGWTIEYRTFMPGDIWGMITLHVAMATDLYGSHMLNFLQKSTVNLIPFTFWENNVHTTAKYVLLS